MTIESIALRVLLTWIALFFFIKMMYGALGEYRGTRIYWQYLIPALISIWFWRS